MSDSNLKAIFKAYDVRGIYPDQLDEKTAYSIGQAYAAVRKPKKVAVGRDVRNSGKKLKEQLILALVESGVDVIDIGTIATDQLYFTVGNYGFDGGISVTASHNPAEYNGFKFSGGTDSPIDSHALELIRDWAMSDKKLTAAKPGVVLQKDILDDYVSHVLGYIDPSQIKPLKILANANFGAVGRGVDIIANKLGLELERINWQEDGSFPKGSPNPLLPENRAETVAAIKAAKPDFGVAWDADADRCFLFCDDGTFVPACYLIALLAKQFLKQYPGSKIVHDVTTAWVIDDAVKNAGGTPVMSRTGYTFIKSRMRQEDAPFAGEAAGHFYFRDSFYADNGLVPLLLILQMVSQSGKSLKELVGPLMDRCKVSDETNFTVDDPARAIKLIEEKMGKEGRVDKTDGLIVDSGSWRFSVRPSNTEPLFRLNVEAHNQKTVDQLMARISSLINT